jgi:outer membrane protein insertion porin family
MSGVKRLRILFACALLPALCLVVAADDVDVTFPGATSFPPERLRKAIAEQLQDIASSGLTPARADDAAWFLGSFYRREGFAKADVTFEIRTSQLVLRVTEGPRTLVRSLVFRGNHAFDGEALSPYMSGIDAAEIGKAGLPFSEAEVAAGAERVAGFYASEGYLDAKTDTGGTRILGGGASADIVVRIREGRRYRIGAIAFKGRTVLDTGELTRALDLESDQPFTPFTTDEMQRVLRSYYRSRGFFAAKVEVTADRTLARDGAVPITVTCEPGVPFRIGRVVPRGLDRVTPEFIEMRFASLTGKVYDPAALETRYREMVKTGLFKTLHVRPVEAGADVLVLDVEVEEAKQKEFGFELGYASYDGASAGLRVGDRNFLRTGRPLTLAVQYSQRGFRGALEYVDPWFLESAWTFRGRL